MAKPLCIAHLYPELLNLYADKGNIQTLRKRLEWRHIPVRVESVRLGDPLRLTDYDLVLLGGGSDREQGLIGQTLRPLRDEWRHAVADGLPVLGICGGYQLLGEYYRLGTGEVVEGLGVLDMRTEPGSPRLIGNVAIDVQGVGSVVGFENHAGRTYHNHTPLGRVIAGHGNNGEDRMEGVRYINVFGTYIHGPLLPKNPRLADYVLAIALERAGLPSDLAPLDDAVEQAAHQAFLMRRVNQTVAE